MANETKANTAYETKDCFTKQPNENLFGGREGKKVRFTLHRSLLLPLSLLLLLLLLRLRLLLLLLLWVLLLRRLLASHSLASLPADEYSPSQRPSLIVTVTTATIAVVVSSCR